MTVRMFKKASKKRPRYTKSQFFPRHVTNQVKDMVNLTASYLEMKDLIQMATVCHDSYNLYDKPLSVKKLLQAVIDGNFEKAEAMISKNPALLFERGTVKDYAGRIHVNRTAYQLALGACDFNVVDLHGQIVGEGMVEMIEKYFKQFPGKNSQEIYQVMRAQWIGQFPEGYEKIENQKLAEDLRSFYHLIKTLDDAEDNEIINLSKIENQIHVIVRDGKSKSAADLKNRVQAVINAYSRENFEIAFVELSKYLIEHDYITDEAFNMDVLKALYQFRNQLECTHSKILGYHFNYSLLKEALQFFNEDYVQYDLESPKNLLYCQKIFGYIERFLPAQDARNMAQGIWNIMKEHEKSKRSLELKVKRNYYPLDSLDPDNEIGYRSAVTSIGWPVKHMLITKEDRTVIEKYFTQKQQNRSLYAPCDSYAIDLIKKFG